MVSLNLTPEQCSGIGLTEPTSTCANDFASVHPTIQLDDIDPSASIPSTTSKSKAKKAAAKKAKSALEDDTVRKQLDDHRAAVKSLFEERLSTTSIGPGTVSNTGDGSLGMVTEAPVQELAKSPEAEMVSGVDHSQLQPQ
jgi:hypothetical protein